MIKEMFYKLKIKTKIIIFYITILIVSFILTYGAMTWINRLYIRKEIGKVGTQTVNALIGNLSFIFDNVTQFSNLIYFDENIQNSLKKIESNHILPDVQRNIKKSLINMLLSGEYISSVFIFDRYFNNYSSYKVGPIVVDKNKIQQTKWYREMKQNEGNGFFIHNSEGVLDFPTRNGKQYISYIREIGDKSSYEPIAILFLTIDIETIQNYFQEVRSSYNSQFFIVNSKGEFIVPPNENIEEYKSNMDKIIGEELSTISVEHSEMMIVSQPLQIQDWKLVGSFSIKNKKIMASYYSKGIFIIMILNAVFVFICSLLLTRLIFEPLSKLGNHMKLVENGIFEEIPLGKEENEIVNLTKVFNHMTVSIQNLIEKIKQEEKIIAKGKLDLIEAQINPHFLYNTLDAVSALALLKDYENCFKITQALGNFYRNSLNSGMDFVLVKEEIECIRSYITILNIRYDNNITVHYDIEKEIENLFIPKLLLQPLIENAVYHGIKKNDGKGTIEIKGYLDEQEIIFIIVDDGYGMTEERIEKVLNNQVKTGHSGFGIHSLIQRIYFYDNIESPLTIHSEIGNGTEVTVRVGVRTRREDNWQ